MLWSCREDCSTSSSIRSVYTASQGLTEDRQPGMSRSLNRTERLLSAYQYSKGKSIPRETAQVVDCLPKGPSKEPESGLSRLRGRHGICSHEAKEHPDHRRGERVCSIHVLGSNLHVVVQCHLLGRTSTDLEHLTVYIVSWTLYLLWLCGC